MTERSPQTATRIARRVERVGKALNARQKAREATTLRLVNGLTFREIAERLGWADHSGPRRAVEAEMRRQGLDRPIERLEEWRLRQLAEINGMLEAWYPRSVPTLEEDGTTVLGDPYAVAIVERCWKARSSLLGLSVRKEELLEALAGEGGDESGLDAILAQHLRKLAEDRRRRLIGEPGLIDRDEPPLLPEPSHPPGLRIAEARIVPDADDPPPQDAAEPAPEGDLDTPTREPAKKPPLDDTLVGKPLKL